MRHGFKINDLVVHPNHGIGSVGRTVEMEVSGESHRFLVVDFRRTALTLRIPEAAIEQSGLRRVSSKETMQAALAVLPAPRAVLAGHWSRWSNIYVAKLNSGKPELLAEILRDLSPTGGSWKARLYEEALHRFAEELALVEDIDVSDAERVIEGQLPSDAEPRQHASS
jgi:CarD family transcriptional regulator